MCIANITIPYTLIQVGIYVKFTIKNLIIPISTVSIADNSHVAPRIPKGFKSIFIKMPPLPL